MVFEVSSLFLYRHEAATFASGCMNGGLSLRWDIGVLAVRQSQSVTGNAELFLQGCAIGGYFPGSVASADGVGVVIA